MSVEFDYYQLLGVSRTADTDEINAAIKKTTREWRKRTEAPDLGTRQEAEVMVQRIQQAREILLHAPRRSQYDSDLRQGGVTTVETKAVDGSWLAAAREALARGDYHSAAYAAREATQQTGNSPESWWLRSRANAGLGQLNDAYYEAQQAVQLERANATYHFHLGCVAEDMRKWDLALQEFNEASRLDPSVIAYELAVGGVFWQNGMVEKAFPIVQRIHRDNPDDENACYYMAGVLIDMAEAVPRYRDGENYLVTKPEEIAQMRSLVRQGLNVRKLPSEARTEFRRIDSYLDQMEAKKFKPPIAAFAPTSCLGVVLFVAVVLSPIWLVIGGFATMADGNIGGFLMLLLGVGLGFLFYKLSYVPGWKVNARTVG